ncbi:MAG: hypothetical protein Q8M07_04765 [Prosthecobacter sp.]|nr:hypothetical protein [Prosthecobacter sp.]
MVVKGVPIIILSFEPADNSFAGWLECEFRDVHGKAYRFWDKVEVVTIQNLDENSNFPVLEHLACEVLDEQVYPGGRTICRIDPWLSCVEISDSVSVFEVSKDALVSFDAETTRTLQNRKR